MHKLKSEMVRTRAQREIIKKMCLCLRQTCIECEKTFFSHSHIEMFFTAAEAVLRIINAMAKGEEGEGAHTYLFDPIHHVTLRIENKPCKVVDNVHEFQVQSSISYRRASRCHIEKASQDRKERKNDKKRTAIKRTTLGPVMKSSSRPGVKHVNMAIRGEPRAPTSKAKDLRARTSD